MVHSNDDSYSIMIDDDTTLAEQIESVTHTKIIQYSSISEFKKHARQDTPTAVFLEIHLGQEENGIDLIPPIRSQWPYCPIIVVTTDPSDDAVGQALAAGAHDFMRKPFSPKELSARLRARAFELSEKVGRDTLHVGDFILNLPLSKLTGPDGTVHLSQTDTRLLQYLSQSNGTVVSRQDLKRKIWGNVAVSDNALDKKLYDIRVAIRNVGSQTKLTSSYRQGFSLVTPNGATAEHSA